LSSIVPSGNYEADVRKNRSYTRPLCPSFTEAFMEIPDTFMVFHGVGTLSAQRSMIFLLFFGSNLTML
jgi:hypothetical protein